MMKMSQLLAIEKSKRTAAETDFTSIYRALDKKELFVGLARNYKPKNSEGETLTPERKHVQARVTDQFKKVHELLTEIFNMAATKAATNCVAKANVVVDGKELLKDVPATHLLELEAKLVNLIDFARKLPVLDPGYEWALDTNSGLWKTPIITNQRTKKEPRVITLAPATDKHPAQTQLLQEDVHVGDWEATHMSGALPSSAAEELIKRIQKVQAAVKSAREQANMVSVVELKSSPLLDYIFAPA